MRSASRRMCRSASRYSASSRDRRRAARLRCGRREGGSQFVRRVGGKLRNPQESGFDPPQHFVQGVEQRLSSSPVRNGSSRLLRLCPEIVAAVRVNARTGANALWLIQ